MLNTRNEMVWETILQVTAFLLEKPRPLGVVIDDSDFIFHHSGNLLVKRFHWLRTYHLTFTPQLCSFPLRMSLSGQKRRNVRCNSAQASDGPGCHPVCAAHVSALCMISQNMGAFASVYRCRSYR